MFIWISVAIGAFVALLFGAEIYFGRLSKRQMARGAGLVLTTLGFILLYWYGLPTMEKLLRDAGCSQGISALVIIALLVLFAVLGRRRRKKASGSGTPRQ